MICWTWKTHKCFKKAGPQAKYHNPVYEKSPLPFLFFYTKINLNQYIFTKSAFVAYWVYGVYGANRVYMRILKRAWTKCIVCKTLSLFHRCCTKRHADPGSHKKYIKFVYFEQIFITMMDPSESKAKDNCKYGDFDQPIAH